MEYYDKFNGVFSLLLTPFLENKSIDWDAYDRYVEWQTSFKPNGLFAVCGTSEMKWLDKTERLELARRAVLRSANLPVVATANLEEDPARHSDEVLEMAGTGVSGIVLIPPDGMGAEINRLKDHLAHLASLSPVPTFIYEWPQVQPYTLPAEVFATLAETAGIAGIKDTTCTLEGISSKIRAVNSNVIVYQANMSYMIEALELGASGIMTVSSGCFGDWVVDLWKSRHNEFQMKSTHYRLLFLDVLLRLGYPVTSKYIVQQRGIKFGLTTRWPSVFPEETAKALQVFMSNISKNSEALLES